jgi:hypothetical protein
MTHRLIVREMGGDDGDFWHDESLSDHAYEAAALWMNGLREAGWFVDDHFGSAQFGYEDWRLTNVRSLDSEVVLVSLTRED